MNAYQSHKRVKAAQIKDVSPVDSSKHVTLILDDGGKFHAGGPMYMRYFPQIGDYLVEYEDGYKSISPQKAFEEGYAIEQPEPIRGQTFGWALKQLQNGTRVARAGWNGKGMWLAYMSGMTLPSFNTQGTDRKVNDRTAIWIGIDTPLETLPYIAMWTADKKWLPGWLASQTDMLAVDWEIVPGQ